MDYAQKGGEEGRDSRGAERRGEREGMGRGWLSGLYGGIDAPAVDVMY